MRINLNWLCNRKCPSRSLVVYLWYWSSDVWVHATHDDDEQQDSGGAHLCQEVVEEDHEVEVDDFMWGVHN